MEETGLQAPATNTAQQYQQTTQEQIIQLVEIYLWISARTFMEIHQSGQLWIPTIGFIDIHKCNCGYLQLDLSISTI